MSNIKLRPYQEKARHWVNQQLNQGNNPLLVMPCGSGKSPTSAAIAADRISLKKRLLVLVPQYELFSQMIVDYSFLNPGYIDDTGVNGRSRNIYICMVQSLSSLLNALPEKFCKSFDEIIIDEAQYSAAQMWIDIFKHFDHCLLFGMSGTPYRLDNKSLGNYYDSMYEPITIKECIEKGYLSKPVLIIPEEYKQSIPKNISEDQINKDIIQRGKFIGDMVAKYKEVFNGKPIIAPCTTTEHARQIAEMYKNAGWVVDHIHSGLTKHERSRIIKDIRKGKTNILITVGVGIYGLNIVGLCGIIWFRYTESLTIWMQFNGRPARITEGKDKYVIIDPTGSALLHGSPDIDRKWSLEIDYKPGTQDEDVPTMKFCPSCSTANAQTNEKCWICGYDFIAAFPVEGKRRKLPKFIDGDLVWLDDYNGEKIDKEGKENGKRRQNDGDNIYFGNDRGNTNINIREITRAEKLEILKRDLTGLNRKTKFREGVKWL